MVVGAVVVVSDSCSLNPVNGLLKIALKRCQCEKDGREWWSICTKIETNVGEDVIKSVFYEKEDKIVNDCVDQ